MKLMGKNVLSTASLSLFLLFLAAAFFAAAGLSAQEATSQTNEDFLVVGVKEIGGFGVPVGSCTDVFESGGGTFLMGIYSFPFYPPLALNIGPGYHYAPIKADTSVSLVYGGAGLTLRYLLGPRFDIGLWSNGGYAYGMLNDDSSVSGSVGYVQGGPFLSFFIDPQFSLALEGTYRHFFGLYQDVQVGVSAAYYFNKRRIKGVEFLQPDMQPVFPLQQRWYEEHPVGTIGLTNVEDQTLEEVEVSLYIPRIMEEPRSCRVSSEIPPGGTVRAELLADFSDLELEYEKTKTLKARIEFSGKYKLFRRSRRYSAEIEILPNYSIRWDDFRKAALFVTENDPAVAASVAEVDETLAPLYCRRLDGLLVELLGLYRLFGENGYALAEENPTPFVEYAHAPEMLDTVQPPHLTAEHGSGDSAELSFLFTSAAKAAGLEPAFLILPGGGMVCAFDAGPADEEGRMALEQKYYRVEELFIENDGRFWLPIDVRDPELSFLEAVSSGRELWNRVSSSNPASPAMVELREAREEYSPTSFPEISGGLQLPENFGEIYKEAERDQIAWMLEEEIERREEEIESSGGDVRSINSLGVLRAGYEQFNKAATQFQKVLLQSEYMPALINMGNIYFMREDMKMALPFYERAYAVAAFDPRVILAVAKANHKLENYGSAKDAYAKLESIDPELAEKYRYLSLSGEEAVEAAKQIEDRDVVEWIEE